MIRGKNLTLAGFLKRLNIRYRESNTQFWSVPDEA